MRISVVHNESAGGGGPSSAEIEALLRAEGHEPRTGSREALDALLAEASDVVLAAGGDGTVDTVAPRLSGDGRALAVMPLGSANNVARSLGLPSEREAVAAMLAGAARRPVDLLAAEGPWGERRTIESAGLGALAAAFAEAKGGDHAGEDKIEAGRRLAAEHVRDARPIDATLRLDGEAMTGPLIEASFLNLACCGPRLCLAPQADPGDGLIDVVLVREADRDGFAGWVASGGDGPPPAEARRARSVQVMMRSGVFRASDDFHEGEAEVTLRVLPSALDVLTPGRPT